MARTINMVSFRRWWLLQNKYYAVFLVLVVAVGIINAQSNIKTGFSCEGRPSGYYADVVSGCQIYHMCDGLGRQFSYSCPNTTLFQQRMLICDHWYMVNCSKSEDDYTANLLIGQREKPFVEDSEDHPYYRTPRPDLLAHPSASEYNIIYRIGRAQAGSSQNLVGADSTEEKNEGPAYFLPSHWSTEYKGKGKTRNSQKVNLNQEAQAAAQSNFKDTSSTRTHDNEAFNEIKSNAFKRIDTDVSQTIPVNFRSNFPATTPVYPKFVEPEAPLASGQEELHFATGNVHTVVLPPAFAANTVTNRGGNFNANMNRNRNSNQQIKEATNNVPVAVNYRSNFKATTPVYPVTLDDETIAKNNFDFGELTVGNPHQDESPSVVVNFNSDFKATTPVYPTAIDEETKARNEYDFGQLLPLSRNDRYTVNLQSDFVATTPVYPNFVDPALVRKHNADFEGETPQLGDVVVNYASVYKATTPVYPKEVDPSVHLAGGGTFIGVAEGIAHTIVPPRPSHNPSQPSNTFQPPRYRDGFNQQNPVPQNSPLIQHDGLVVRKAPNTEQQWEDLRTMFLIPDYDFPLETVRRPAYESKGPSSFQVNHSAHTIENA